MKYGAHCFILTDHWSDQSLPLLDQAKSLGLDCFEIAVGDDVTVDARKLRKHAASLGLELIISPGGTWPVHCDLTADDPEERQAGLDWHSKQLDLAGELGAPAYTGALYGHPGTVKRRRPPGEEIKWASEGLHQLATHGEKRSVQVVIEPMSHFRTHVINTAQQAKQLLKRTDHPNLHILLDTYHLVTEITDYAAAIQTTGTDLWGLHACENHRGIPGTGILPWPAIFQALHTIAFDGYIILETYNSAIGDFAFERGMFHNVCPDAEAFINNGMSFMKNGLESAKKA